MVLSRATARDLDEYWKYCGALDVRFEASATARMPPRTANVQSLPGMLLHTGLEDRSSVHLKARHWIGEDRVKEPILNAEYRGDGLEEKDETLTRADDTLTKKYQAYGYCLTVSSSLVDQKHFTAWINPPLFDPPPRHLNVRTSDIKHYSSFHYYLSVHPAYYSFWSKNSMQSPIGTVEPATRDTNPSPAAPIDSLADHKPALMLLSPPKPCSHLLQRRQTDPTIPTGLTVHRSTQHLTIRSIGIRPDQRVPNIRPQLAPRHYFTLRS